MTDYNKQTNEQLATHLRTLSQSLRKYTTAERIAILEAASDRLVATDDVQPIDLGGDFTYVPSPRTGTLFHPVAEDGVFLRDLEEAEARDVVSVLTASPHWNYEPTGARIEGTS